MWYRISNNAMYGTGGLDVGTYWTPRWDAIVRMARSIVAHFTPHLPPEDWRTTIYKVEDADMTDPPEEHKWAFNYASDAGEKCLVRMRSEPEVVFEGQPTDAEFIKIALEEVKPCVDWAACGVEVILDGIKGWIGWDYDTKTVDLYVKEDWQFVSVKTIRSMKEWEACVVKYLDLESDNDIGLGYFFRDIGWV